MFGAVFAFAIVLADATPAAAPAPTKTASIKVNKDGMVCHTEEVLGSRIPKKVCMTPAAAADRAAQDRQMLDHLQQNNGFVKN